MSVPVLYVIESSALIVTSVEATVYLNIHELTFTKFVIVSIELTQSSIDL